MGAGIAHYDIYVKTGDGEWELWLNNATDSSANFFADSRNTYSFYSVAFDGAGLSEATPDENTEADSSFEIIPVKMVLLEDLEWVGNETTATYQFNLAEGDPGSQWRIEKSMTLSGEWTSIETVTLDDLGGAQFQDTLNSEEETFYRAVYIIP